MKIIWNIISNNLLLNVTSYMSGPSASALSTHRPVTTTSAPSSRARAIGTALIQNDWEGYYKLTGSYKVSINQNYLLQLTPANSNLQGKSKKVRVIGSSSYWELEENSQEQGKKPFYCTVSILITFNCGNVE